MQINERIRKLEKALNHINQRKYFVPVFIEKLDSADMYEVTVEGVTYQRTKDTAEILLEPYICGNAIIFEADLED